jgi:hypothetical protein
VITDRLSENTYAINLETSSEVFNDSIATKFLSSIRYSNGSGAVSHSVFKRRQFNGVNQHGRLRRVERRQPVCEQRHTYAARNATYYGSGPS